MIGCRRPTNSELIVSLAATSSTRRLLEVAEYPFYTRPFSLFSAQDPTTSRSDIVALRDMMRMEKCSKSCPKAEAAGNRTLIL